MDEEFTCVLGTAQLSLAAMTLASGVEWVADFGNYETKSGEKVHKRTALGLAFLLFASEAVRRYGGSRSIWLAIKRALGEHQEKLLMLNAGVPNSPWCKC